MENHQQAPVRLIVHGHAGTGPQVMADALLLAVQSSDEQVRWETVSMPGDRGAAAMRALIDEPGRPDLLSTCTPSFLQTPLLDRLPYSYRDLTPIARLVRDWYLVLVPENSRLKSASDFVSLVRSRRSRTGGHFAGSINHLLGLDIGHSLNSDVKFVPLESTHEFISALAGQTIDWGVSAPVEVADGLASGELRPLAVTCHQRLPEFPDTPTLKEVGVPVEFELWRGVMGPPEIDPATQERWWRRLQGAVRAPPWLDYLNTHAQADGLMEGRKFEKFLVDQNDWFAKGLASAGLI